MPSRSRSGVTVIELMIVVVIMVMLVTLSVPSMGEALARTRVSSAANMIQEAHRQARALARRSGLPNPLLGPVDQVHFGVVVTADYAAVTYGLTAGSGNILTRAGKPVAKFDFPKGVMACAGTSAFAGGEVKWLYEYGSAYPVTDFNYMVPATPVDGRVINIGMIGSPVCSELTVRNVDATPRGRHHAGVRIFKTGIVHVDLQ
jgi:type II secretory pathway pseudopilin PulG